jgi:pimeloyl-ACP methyl ester carboxylesterase
MRIHNRFASLRIATGIRALLAVLIAAAQATAGEPKTPWGVRGQLPLNLEPLFDNDAIADAQNRADGNFDCPDHPADLPGSVFPAEHLPASGSAFMLDEVWYLFPSKEPGDDNNVACNGQRIAVPPGRYRALHVLGASENGNNRGPLGLTYREGPAEAELALTDWCQPPRFGERVAFEAACRYTYSSDLRRVVREEVRPRLFLQTIPLDAAKTLETLALPYCRRMHLFAATLEAVAWEQGQVDYANETAELYESLHRRKPEDTALLRRKLESLLAELDALAAAPGPFARQFGWLRAQAEYTREQLGQSVVGRYHLAPGRLMALSKTIRTIGMDLQALQHGDDPFPARRGNFLRSYRSPLDGSLQSYSLSVPGDYTGGGPPFPLVVSLHGHGWYRPFQGHPQPVVEGVLLVAPHGRGSIDYMLAAEADVLAVMDDVCRDYRVDPDRIVLEGHSMGGTGSWQLGVHYPQRFAALAPACGNADRRAWDAWKPPLRRTREPHPLPPRFAALRTHLLDTIDPITYAGNLLHVPVLVAHGAEDDVVPVGHSRNMALRLHELGGAVEYCEFPFLRHWGFPPAFYAKRWAWVLAQRRDAAPEHVRLKTASLRHNEAYWVRIERLLRPLAFAELDARHLGDGRLEVKTDNVAAFTLDLRTLPQVVNLREVQVEVDGAALKASLPSPTFVRTSRGRWRVADLPRGLAKKQGLEGPVADAFLDSFLLVRGTTSPDPWEREVIRREVEARARDWERLFHCRPRVKDDTAVTDADLREHHLVLYGGPAANALTGRVAGKLPVRIEADRIRVGRRSFSGPDVGVKLLYPNPLNPERYVVVFAGLSPAALDQVNNRFGNWFGWGPYDNYEWFDYGVFDARTYDPESFLVVGFFDPAWQLDEETQFVGDEAVRAGMLPRRVPPLHALPSPAPATLPLSDLAPSLLDQHKGCAGLDRSFEGGPLELGDRAFERGLGVKPPSVLEYQLDGQYAVFRATVGIDLEGALEVSPARARGEWVQFRVVGDGRQLYSSEWLQWNSKPVEVAVPIKGVKTLRLEVDCSASRWLVGSADWADARVER